MALTLIATTDYIVAKDHPKFTDIKNRDAIYLHGLHLIGHDADGKHNARLCACVGEQDTFTGNGTFPRIITLTNTALLPKIVICWEQPVTGSLITNGGFDSATTGWTALDCSAASVAGGQAGNCLEITQGTTDLITNGGFATDMTGWTTSGTLDGGIAGGQAGNCCRGTHPGVSTVSMVQFYTDHCPRSPYQPKAYGKCTDATLLGVGQQFYLNGTACDLSDAWVQRVGAVQHFDATGIGNTTLLTYVGLTGTHYIYYDTFTCLSGGGVTQAFSCHAFKSYTLAFYVKSGTSGNEAFRVGVYGSSLSPYVEVDGTTSGSWVLYTTTFTPLTDATVTLALIKDSLTAGTMLFDSVVVTENPGGFPLRIDASPYTIDNRADITAITEITTLSAGVFTIADAGLTARNLNTNGRENYYCVLGIDETTAYPGDTGSGTDPDWVEDDEQMIGGAVGTEVANKVEKHIYDALVVGHTSTGEHIANPFADLMAIETGTATGTGSEQTVTLENTGIEVKEVMIFDMITDSDVYTALDTMTMPDSKKEDTAAFTSGMVQSMGTGEFSFIGVASRAYYWCVLGIQ